MNRNHWSSYTEQQLAVMRAGGQPPVVHASRTGHGPLPLDRVPDVTAQTRALLNGLRIDTDPGPAYPAEWLPELKAQQFNSLRGAQTPADWLDENRPDTVTQRNGTAPHDAPAADAYPAEWLQSLGPLGGAGLGGEGFINDRRAA